MQTVRARVTAVAGEEAEVEVEAGGCGRCHETGGCGGQNLSRAFCGVRRYRVHNDLAVRPGDRVSLGVSDLHVRSAANRAYLTPLGCMLLGALAGAGISSAASAGGAFVGLLSGWLALVLGRRKDLSPPRMIERLADE